MKTIPSLIASKLQLTDKQVSAVIALLGEKATIPFIARYRKERTGSLDEVQIAAIQAEYNHLTELEDRKQTILKTIEESGALTYELRQRIINSWDATELEDIYLPYKPHRKTRADQARERGLAPLAETLERQDPRLDVIREASKFLNDDVKTADEALQGARDILAEQMNMNESARAAIRREFSYSARLTTKAVAAKADETDAQNFRDYFRISEPLKRIPSHRLLAIRRAESEGFIRVDISPDPEKALDKLARLFLKGRGDASYQVELAIEDCYKRLLRPAIETEFAASSKAEADTAAIRVFAANLRELLLDAPLGQRRVLALDPGFRTGCKLVCLTAQGDLVYHSTVFPHQPIGKVAEASKLLKEAIRKYGIEAIAIGNGTASRETEAWVNDTLAYVDNHIDVFVVSENGASVYSASKIAREEFPNEDVTVRGAVSIGRRLMDPLAELVKIDPKSIGVGQYQHDVDQVRLRDSLQQTVESVVNHVGVDVNTASKYLLTYISGLGPVLANNIVEYRAEYGPYPNRKALMAVPKMGPKTFEQAAGFLRVSGGDNPLDNSAVHPECYDIVAAMAKDQNCRVEDLLSNSERRAAIDPARYVTEEVGLPTITDILHELDKPTRDPRVAAGVFHFDDTVHTIDDLREGMELPGIVTNISDFGAFVDIGVHKDGLIHISQFGRRVRTPQEVVRLHQHIRVRVLQVDKQRARISLGLVW